MATYRFLPNPPDRLPAAAEADPLAQQIADSAGLSVEVWKDSLLVGLFTPRTRPQSSNTQRRAA